jgi:hypothetical protein
MNNYPDGDGVNADVNPTITLAWLRNKVRNIRLDTSLTTTQYTASVVHEEGHANGFINCPEKLLAPDGIGCQVNGSVMGPQSPRDAGAPTSPTTCDIHYYKLYSTGF